MRTDESYPYVCPGCYAVADQPCAPDCPEVARELRAEEEARERASLDDRDALEDDDDETGFFGVDFFAPRTEPDDAPASQRQPALEHAAQDIDRAERQLGEAVGRLLEALNPRPSEGERSCRWCRKRIRDDFEHDFCEPDDDDEPTVPRLRIVRNEPVPSRGRP